MCERENTATKETAEWWAGPFFLNGPAQFAGACAERVRRRGGDLPGLRCTGHRAGSGGHRTNIDGGVRSGNDGATGAALHLVGSGMVLAVELCPVSAVPSPGIVTLPRVGAPGVRRRPGKLLVWPVTLDISVGGGHGRSLDHRPLGGCSALVGAGEAHDIRRDRQLYGVQISDQPVTPAP